MQLASQPRITPGEQQEVARHWLTAAGVVIAATGMIAAAPGLSPVPATLQHDIQAGAVRLTAGWDPLAAWKDALDTSIANGTVLGDNFLLAPGVGLQQAIVNQIGYAKQFFDDPSSFEAVSKQFAANVMKVASGLTLIGADEDITDAALKRTLGGLHGMMFDMLPGMLPDSIDPEMASAVMNVLASPLSGVLMGFAGPTISPAVALLNSAMAVATALQSEDPSTALSAMLDVPANVINGFLNGATLNLDMLAPVLNDAGVMPDGITIGGVSLAFGGLLTPGATDRSPYEVKDEEGNVIKTIDPVGGSIFNSLGLKVNLGAIGIDVKPEAIGPIGALQGLSQTVGVLLGSGWDDYDGKGNAPAPTPPLFGLDPLTFGDPLSDIAENAGVTKLRDMLKTAAVNDIVKKLQGIDTTTEAAADETVADKVVDTTGPGEAAPVTELTHTTANKMVAVTVPAPDTASESAATATTTEDVTETAATDATESAGTATAPKVRVAPKAATDQADASAAKSQRKLAHGIRDAVKNARNGFGGTNSRTSNESTSGSADSTAGSSSSGASKSDNGSSHSSAKAKVKAKTTKAKSNKE
ncbi:outer membrane porin GjpA [Mycolicibacterium sp. 050232]|uniref:outer membrane porin GjpA n=1 Tax=Mycolicibacterium sp. 050232 TaxID=3113982 RepID=UPI002E2A4CF1|nr:outer membrane porin GjpA [Mycolicibacterium sp. 050232]MED5812349.1 outer membrane porin GjpA [Mycolicibacterium sp. 050232]